ncbi:MAG TPA: Hsp70 family protein [Pyrinomonadaceae bacterium]
MPARLPVSNVLRIINEPTAGALAYGLDKKKDIGNSDLMAIASPDSSGACSFF